MPKQRNERTEWYVKYEYGCLQMYYPNNTPYPHCSDELMQFRKDVVKQKTLIDTKIKAKI